MRAGRHTASRLGSAAGFTLVELLVALMLFALMSMVLFGGFHFGMRAWEAGGARIDRFAGIEPVQNLLRLQLSQATLPHIPVHEEAQAPVSAFAGFGNELRFIAPLPGHAGSGGLYVFLLSAQQAGARGELRMSWQIYRPDSLGPEWFAPMDTSSLLDDVAGVQFSYYGSNDFTETPRWHETWSSTLGLPQLIRVRVSFPAGDLRQWPDLVVAPLLSPRTL